MIAHFNNIEKDWRIKAEGRKCADRMCNNCVGQPGAGAGYQVCFFYSASEKPYMRKTSSLETVPRGCYCLSAENSRFRLYFRCDIK